MKVYSGRILFQFFIYFIIFFVFSYFTLEYEISRLLLMALFASVVFILFVKIFGKSEDN